MAVGPDCGPRVESQPIVVMKDVLKCSVFILLVIALCANDAIFHKGIKLIRLVPIM